MNRQNIKRIIKMKYGSILNYGRQLGYSNGTVIHNLLSGSGRRNERLRIIISKDLGINKKDLDKIIDGKEG